MEKLTRLQEIIKKYENKIVKNYVKCYTGDDGAEILKSIADIYDKDNHEYKFMVYYLADEAVRSRFSLKGLYLADHSPNHLYTTINLNYEHITITEDMSESKKYELYYPYAILPDADIRSLKIRDKLRARFYRIYKKALKEINTITERVEENKIYW